jgi:ferredoxin-NADP reductase
MTSEPASTQTLYPQLGGEAAVDAAVDVFYRKVLSDDRVSRFFDDVDMYRQIAKQKSFLTMVFGARTGDRVSVLGPSGECFYVPGKEEQTLLLVGTGTGLAPLYGILRDAFCHGHRGPIHLFHGAVHKAGLHLVEELRHLVDLHSHVAYTAAVLNGTESEHLTVGPIAQVVLKRLPKLSAWRGYICGDPTLVQSLKKKRFLSGMGSREIYADAFIPSAQTS